jgi:hypothetical protein
VVEGEVLLSSDPEISAKSARKAIYWQLDCLPGFSSCETPVVKRSGSGRKGKRDVKIRGEIKRWVG